MPRPATILRRSSPLVLLAARAGRARQRRRLARAGIALAGAAALGVAALIGTRVRAHRRAADGPPETASAEPGQAHAPQRSGDGGEAATPFAARYGIPTPEAAGARGGSEPADAEPGDGEPVRATPPAAVRGSQTAAGA